MITRFLGSEDCLCFKKLLFSGDEFYLTNFEGNAMSIRGFDHSSRGAEREKFQWAKQQQEPDHQMKHAYLESQCRSGESARSQALSSQQTPVSSTGEKKASLVDRV